MVTVYTASMGGYDVIPAMDRPDPSIRYVCFTDGTCEVPEPWEHRLVPRLFDDPVVDSKRIKILPHLYLPDDDVSLWIDAHVQLHGIGSEQIDEWLGDGSFSLPDNPLGDCAYEDGEFLATWGYDDPAAIRAQLARFRAVGFPEHVGLASPLLIARRHWEPEALRLSNAWWQNFVSYARRDQVSFPFAAWSVGSRYRLLDFDYRDTPFLTWGPSGGGKHVRPRPDPVIRAGNGFAPLAVRPPAASPHSPIDWDEPLSRQLLVRMAALGGAIRSTGEDLEGNICFFPRNHEFEWSPPDPRLSAKRDALRRAVADRSDCVEVGFNAGHSATLLLSSNEQLRLTAVDSARSHYSKLCAELIGSWFPDRFEVFWGDRPEVLQDQWFRLQGADMVLIDGGQGSESLGEDLDRVVELTRTGTRIVVDDMLSPDVAGQVHHFVGLGKLQMTWPSRTSEIGVFETIA